MRLLGVGQDVGDVGRQRWSGRPWWWQHRRRMIARSVRIHSIARAGRDRDALLRLDAQRDEAGRDARHDLAGLTPGQRPPVLADGVAVTPHGSGSPDTGVEQLADILCTRVDDFHLLGVGALAIGVHLIAGRSGSDGDHGMARIVRDLCDRGHTAPRIVTDQYPSEPRVRRVTAPAERRFGPLSDGTNRRSVVRTVVTQSSCRARRRRLAWPASPHRYFLFLSRRRRSRARR